ncbi:MAG: Crp/Fnr family transcriptional regulator [Alkaliphilus sp.]
MYEILERSLLFTGLSTEEIKNALGKIHFEINEFNRGETGYSEVNYKNKIVIILSGVARVEQNQEDGSIIFMKRLQAGDVFGVLTICCEFPLFPTSIVFEKASRVLLLSEESLLTLIQSNRIILTNYLTFLNGRVRFLFNRISLFTTSLVDKKLMLYLEHYGEKVNSSAFILPYNKVELAEYLGVSRSSLYRAFDKLSASGIISVNGKCIELFLPYL